MTTAVAELEEMIRALNPSDNAALIRLLIGELDGPPEPVSITLGSPRQKGDTKNYLRSA